MKTPYNIILGPMITEKSVRLSYGDPTIKDDDKMIRKYTFKVAPDANKIEIKRALEAIYNVGKKKEEDKIVIATVNTINMKGKTKRQGHRKAGQTPDWKKAVVTLKAGQLLEDYGV